MEFNSHLSTYYVYSHIRLRGLNFITLEPIVQEGKHKKPILHLQKRLLLLKTGLRNFNTFSFRLLEGLPLKQPLQKYILNGSPFTPRFIVVGVMEEWLQGAGSPTVVRHGRPLISNTNKTWAGAGARAFQPVLQTFLKWFFSGAWHVFRLLPSPGQPYVWGPYVISLRTHASRIRCQMVW